MSEVTPDVNVEEPSSAPDPATSDGSAPISVDNGNQEGGAPEEVGPVPYDRFKQVNDKLKTSSDELASLQTKAQKQEAALLQMANYIKGLQANQQPQTPNDPNPEPQSAEQRLQELEAENIKQQLGGDEQAAKLYDMLGDHFESQARQQGHVTDTELDQKLQASEQRVLGRMTSSTRVVNRIADWQQRGLITPEGGAQIQAEVQQAMQQQPDLANNPDSIDYVLERSYTRQLEGGKFQPTFQRANTSPVQPGAPAPAPDPTAVQAEDLKSSRFSMLRNATPEQIKRIRSISMNNYNKATQ